MSLSQIKHWVRDNLVNLKGWTTSRRIVVIESDDWGSIRMPSRSVYDKLLRAGIRVDRCGFCKYDSLASNDDLTELFALLSSFRDSRGSHPVITANVIVANPDFNRIEDDGFQNYHFEEFTETLKRYPKHDQVFTLWKEGLAHGVFYPQLHGREHLNVPRWMSALQLGLSETRMCFDYRMFGISAEISSEKRPSYLAALDARTKDELDGLSRVFFDAQQLFASKFGYSSESFIAPNYVWNSGVENMLKEQGVRFIQSARFQYSPNLESGDTMRIRHFVGEQNSIGQTYLVRNCLFEPSVTPNVDHVDRCLKQMELSFRWRKPAIISSHRVNYVGYIDESNRNRNLKSLRVLISKILKKWPDVEFMTSDELGRLVSASLAK